VSAVMTAMVGGAIRVSLEEPGKVRYGSNGRVTGGVSLGNGGSGVLQFRMMPQASSVTARVYCTDFCIPPLEPRNI
jgi:hypothetical protein